MTERVVKFCECWLLLVLLVLVLLVLVLLV